MQFEDYLPCTAYENQTRHPEIPNFSAFFIPESKLYFFAFLNDKGNVVLKSEGYPQIKSRDNGIQSVLKNKIVRKHFSIKSENAKFFVSLRAGNHQEIARSCDFKTESLAQQFIVELFGENENTAGKKISKAKTTQDIATKPTKSAAKSSIEASNSKKTEVKVPTSKIETKEKVVAIKAVSKEPTSTKTVATKSTVAAEATAPTKSAVETKTLITATPISPVIAASLQTEKKETISTKTIVKSVVNPSKSYASIESYVGHPRLEDAYGTTGYALFSADNKFLFSVYNPDGSIYLRSENFEKIQDRDVAFASVKTHIIDPERYQIREVSDKFVVVLVDEKNNEVARSGNYDSFTQAFASTPKGRTRTTGVTLY